MQQWDAVLLVHDTVSDNDLVFGRSREEGFEKNDAKKRRERCCVGESAASKGVCERKETELGY